LKAARQVVIGGVLVAVGVFSAWLAHIHVLSQTYHPVVRLHSPDGLTYIAVQDAKQERQACGAANDRFLRPVKKGCKDCEVVVARCERELEGFELAVYDGRQIPHHLVSGPGVRMAIQGPEAAAKASCEQIASQMVRDGLRVATCLSPAAAGS
jgi:hypothetical protein